VGRFADTRGRKPTLLIGSIMFILGPLSYILAPSVGLLLVARMFHGIGIAAFTTAYFALVADVTSPSRWGEALGLAGVAPSISIILASPLGTSFTGRVSFPLIFIGAALLALSSLVIVLLIHEPERVSVAAHPENPKKQGFLDVTRLRGVWAPSLATLTVGLTWGAVLSFLPIFARDRGLGNVGFFFTASGVAAILARFVLGRLSDKVGRVSVILPTLIVLGLSMAGLNWTYGFAMLVLIALIHGLGFGGVRVGLDALVVDGAPQRARGTALGILYFCFDSGIAVGSVVIGMLADFAGYGNIYLLLGVMCVLTVIIFAAVMRRPRVM
jgi:MFS family permease